MSMEQGPQKRSMGMPLAQTAPEKLDRQPYTTQIREETRYTGMTSSKSYYDLYPERKRTGPYVPKSTLIGPDSALPTRQHLAAPEDRSIRRSRSGGQLDLGQRERSPTSNQKHQKTSPQQRSADSMMRKGSDQVLSSVSSTYAASSIALGRARPRKITQEPVKSIDDIIRAHSSNLLAVPPSQRITQRSASWSAFEHSVGTHRSSTATRDEGLSDTESDVSDGSVEQEIRSTLRGAGIGQLEPRMAQVSIKDVRAGSEQVRHNGSRKVSAAATGAIHVNSSPNHSPPPQHTKNFSSGLKGLTRCCKVNIAGAPPMQVSFADVGSEDGHAVMVFLGIGASRHLVGLYDELAASLDLRLVCIDRWGIGRTDSVPSESRNILGWSFVVEKVADLLEIDRFSVLAHSAGAPFAAALALLLPERIQGPLNLLAPWTGMQQDSGYRWLRYVPDGVIKTAQAAESRIQTWKLSKESSRSANRAVSAQLDDGWQDRRRYDIDEPERGPTPPAKEHAHRVADNASDASSLRSQRGDSTWSSAQSDEHYDAGSRDAIDGGRPSAASGIQPAQLELERNNALDLLKASHAESSRGLVDDLNLVLGKRPWGFAFSDVHVACEVWHGSKDERIPLSSSMSLSKEMSDCRLHIVDGASHSLMTNSRVVVEVFESISKHANL